MWVDEPIGHRETIEGLWRALRHGRLPHALLFEGLEGIGKYLAACWFVQGIYCVEGPGPACGVCGPCKRIAAGSHPDLFRLDPIEREMETIPVHAITEREGSGERAIESFLGLRPMEGGWRVVVIREFERATAQAQNALLKMLEEPGKASLLILETSRRDRVLETVLSRCVPVRFQTPAAGETAGILAASGIPLEEAELLVRWSRGSPGLAATLHRQGARAIRERLGAVLGGEADPFETTGSIVELEGDFPGKTPAARERGRSRAVVDLALAVARDLLWARGGVDPSTLPHGDLAEMAHRSPSAIADSLRELLALRGEVELNLPPEGILDRTLLALSKAGSERPQGIHR